MRNRREEIYKEIKLFRVKTCNLLLHDTIDIFFITVLNTCNSDFEGKNEC